MVTLTGGRVIVRRQFPTSPEALLAEDTIGPFRTISTIVKTRWCRLVSASAPNGAKVAIKVFELGGSLRPDVGTEKETQWRRRFENEAFLLGGIDHPNVVSLIGQGHLPDGRPYLVMPFLEANLIGEIGGDIGSKGGVARLAPVRRPRPLEIRRAVALLRQILRGVAALHAFKIVHRDIKPGNILLTRQRNGRVRIGDLGMAMVDGRTFDTDGERIGTRGYVAPEMLESPGSVDARADIFAVGRVGFRMLAGRLPIDEERDPSTVLDVPAGIGAIIADALEPDPTNRPSNGADMLRRIEACL